MSENKKNNSNNNNNNNNNFKNLFNNLNNNENNNNNKKNNNEELNVNDNKNNINNENNKILNNMLNYYKDEVKTSMKNTAKLVNNIKKIPLNIIILNILLSLICLFTFTNIYYNLTLSIVFAIITTTIIYFYSGYFSVLFLIFYIIYISQIIFDTYKNRGKIILETNLIKNLTKKPFICDKIQKDSYNIISSKVFRNEFGNQNYCFSLFIYINGSNPLYKNNFQNYRFRDWKSIFYSGDSEILDESKDITQIKQLPGLWLSPTLNNIVCIMNDGLNTEKSTIQDVPLNKWFNITLNISNNSCTIYKDCKLEIEMALKNSIPDTTMDNLYIANDGALVKYNDDEMRNGFAGRIAFLTYYNYNLTQRQINEICENYNSLLNKYQSNDNKKIIYNTSCLVTDSDLKKI